MKAAFLYKARDIRVENMPKPEPSPVEALIKVAAVGICGTDVSYYKYGGVHTRIIREPHIPGHEITGIIESVDVNRFGLRRVCVSAWSQASPAVHASCA